MCHRNDLLALMRGVAFHEHLISPPDTVRNQAKRLWRRADNTAYLDCRLYDSRSCFACVRYSNLSPCALLIDRIVPGASRVT